VKLSLTAEAVRENTSTLHCIIFEEAPAIYNNANTLYCASRAGVRVRVKSSNIQE
jgi:hypothetical protein